MYNRLYIHIPFCRRKCHYCAFISDTPGENDLEEYPAFLLKELQLYASDAGTVASVYFGGGTPSLLQPAQLGSLLDGIAKLTGISTNAEITLEANPGTVDPVSLKGFRDAGINRLSLGIQSFDDYFLKCLGRIHTSDQSFQAFLDAREAGFNNISIDLIHSLPGQSLDQWRSELESAIKINPEHISVYGLTVEEGTPFANIYHPLSPELADEDLSADMFELADHLLTGHGYEHYEIAGYAQPGYRSQHNSGYWLRDGYRGLGVAAHSFLRERNGVRFRNPETLEDYTRQVISGQLERLDEQQLTQHDAMAEYMFLGLRLADGVDRHAFQHEFNLTLESVYGSETADLIRLGLLVSDKDSLTLTRRGIMISNQVFARFLK